MSRWDETPPSTPSTLELLKQVRAVQLNVLSEQQTIAKKHRELAEQADELKRIGAHSIQLLEQVEQAIRYQLEPITERLDDHERRLADLEKRASGA